MSDSEQDRPDLDPDAWDANPADEEHHHPPHGEPLPERGFSGEDEGASEGETPGAR